MSSVVVIVPLVITHWPLIASAITGAVGTLGFVAAREAVMEGIAEPQVHKTRVEVDLPESEILAGSEVTGEQVVVEKDGVRGVFSRNARGGLSLCMEGIGLSKQQLHDLGEELIGRVTQQYVYHRLMTELQQQHFTVVDQSVATDRTVTVRVRRN
jgi:hypothetical protein